MKSTGIIRKTDGLGRIVLPIEMRNNFGICEGDSMEIYTEGSTIILKKHEKGCIFCGERKELIEYKNKNICKTCLDKL